MCGEDTDAAAPISENELVPISALQHLLYCPRQCALIHVERLWMENRFTAEGRILHNKVEKAASDRRFGVQTERSVPLRSWRLGVFGIADVVEVHDDGCVFLVEYKRGRPKQHRADEVQLCAQAICLEEMLDRQIPGGALFYGRTRRRTPVVFDAALRGLTERTARGARKMIATGVTPAPIYESWKCEPCSLKVVCKPEKMQQTATVESWLEEALAD